MLNKGIASLRYDFTEVTSVVDPSITSIPRLPLPSLTVYGSITPARALARLSTILELIQVLMQFPPSPVSIPLIPLMDVLLSLAEAYIPSGRRFEEASVNGVALSPHDQWLLLPSLYPFILQVLVRNSVNRRQFSASSRAAVPISSSRPRRSRAFSSSSSCAATVRTRRE